MKTDSFSSSPVVALVFPGQGSQTLGMLADTAAHYSVVKKTFDEASAVLGYDLWQLTQLGPVEKLNQTEYTQPALLAASVALWRVWLEKKGARPAYLAGHSLGEYSALVCAESLSFVDAIGIVADRGRFMQEAVPAGQGAMAAIVGLDNESVADLCQQVAGNEIVSPANYNSLGQVVVAGDANAVERLLVAAKNAGAKIAKLIPVSVPSHCALMMGAAEKLAKRLEEIKIVSPKIPVVNNVEVQINNDSTAIKTALVRQLFSPVRWVEIIQFLVKQGVKEFIECGPGNVLAGLNKRIDSSVPTFSSVSK